MDAHPNRSVLRSARKRWRRTWRSRTVAAVASTVSVVGGAFLMSRIPPATTSTAGSTGATTATASAGSSLTASTTGSATRSSSSGSTSAANAVVARPSQSLSAGS